MNLLLTTCVIVSLLFTGVLSLFENANVTEVIEYLEANIDETLAYEPPDDFTSYVQTTSNETIDYGTFDFIVIGSGPSGSVIANRLTEIDDWTVLLLEAGGADSDFNKLVGLNTYQAIGDNDWGHVTTPQENACGGMVNRSCVEKAGRIIGGGGSINGAFYMRGHKADFDRWVDIYGATGWSYDEVLPYYKKSENANYEPLAEGYHGTGGYLTITNDVDTPLTETLINGFGEAGFNYTDFNGPATVGITRPPLTYNPNERVSPASAFLYSFLNRTNLEISLNSFVTRVIISNETLNATGVQFVKNQTSYFACARNEVIISAGPWMSAPILLHSGVGPRADLENLDIPVIADLPVGQQLQDHPYFTGITLRTNQTLFNYTFEEEVERYTQHLRPFTSGGDVVAWSDYGQNTTYVRPNIEFAVASGYGAGAAAQKFWLYTDDAIAAMVGDSLSDSQINLGLFHPKSRGTITLKSNDPKDRPLINPNVLSDPSDVEILLKGIQVLLALNQTSAFQNFRIEPYLQDAPGCDDEKYSDDWLVCSLRYWVSSGFHGVAANAIGNDTTSSVVDPNLLVHGIGNLRVADSSIVPESPCGHTQSTAYMVGERASDIIKKAYGKLHKAHLQRPKKCNKNKDRFSLPGVKKCL